MRAIGDALYFVCTCTQWPQHLKRKFDGRSKYVNNNKDTGMENEISQKI